MQTKQCEHCGKPVAIPDSVTREDIEGIISGQMGDFCSRFPALCGQVEAQGKEIKQIKDATTQHPIPSEGLLELWENCPECRPKAEKLGLIEPVEKKEEKEETSSFPWIPSQKEA